MDKIGQCLFDDLVIPDDFLLLNDITKLGEKKTFLQNKANRRNGLWTFRYTPYDFGARKNRSKKSRKSAGKKIEKKQTIVNTTKFVSETNEKFSNFLFLDDMFTISAKEVREIARKCLGCKLMLSDSQDSIKSNKNSGERCRLTVSEVCGTCFIKYS